jgi:hypothetical protein
VVGPGDQVYVAAQGSGNVVAVPPRGPLRQLIGRRGDGTHPLLRPNGLAVDRSGNVYVAGAKTNNAFRVSPSGKAEQILDATGAGPEQGPHFPDSVAVDAGGNVFVAGNNSGNVLAVAPDGTIREVVGAKDPRDGSWLGAPTEVAVAPDGGLYVARMGERALQRIAPDGAVRGVLDETRPDGERRLQMARGLLVDPKGDVYLAGLRSHNVLRIPSAWRRRRRVRLRWLHRGRGARSARVIERRLCRLEVLHDREAVGWGVEGENDIMTTVRHNYAPKESVRLVDFNFPAVYRGPPAGIVGVGQDQQPRIYCLYLDVNSFRFIR